MHIPHVLAVIKDMERHAKCQSRIWHALKEKGLDSNDLQSSVAADTLSRFAMKLRRAVVEDGLVIR